MGSVRCVKGTVRVPVLGRLRLLGWLRLRRGVPQSLEMVADGFARHFGILFVPAAAGVVLFLPLLGDFGWRIAAVLVLSVAGTMAATVLVLRLMRLAKSAADYRKAPPS